jgi:hypothetical protein
MRALGSLHFYMAKRKLSEAVVGTIFFVIQGGSFKKQVITSPTGSERQTHMPCEHGLLR